MLPLLAVIAMLAGCGAVDRVKTSLNAEDGPPDEAPVSYASIPDAVPMDEPLHPLANRRRVGQGRYFVDDVDLGPFSQRGWATWYGRKYSGRVTASGERFDPLAMTAAHQRLPIPSYARVTNLRSGQSVIVRINDRGPAESGGVLALSYAAAAKLGINTPNGGEVDIERLTADDIAKFGRGTPESAQPRSALAATVAPAVVPAPAPAPVPAPAAPAPTAQPAPMLASSIPAPIPTPIPAQIPAPQIPAPIPPPAPAPPPSAAPAVPELVPAPTPDVLAIASPWMTPEAPPPPVPVPFGNPETRRAPAPQVAPPARKETPAPVTAAAPKTAAQAPGRWSVQVGAFAVAETADNVRRFVAEKLTVGAPELAEPDRTPRVESRGTRHFVLIGDSADRADIDALAERVKAVLRQDVVVLRR